MIRLAARSKILKRRVALLSAAMAMTAFTLPVRAETSLFSVNQPLRELYAALDRAMRADVCNQYFCGGLSEFLKSGEPAMPTMVFSGEGKKIRRSPVLTP